MRRTVLLVCVLACIAVPAEPAAGAWSRSVTMPNASNPGPMAVATDGRGDAAVAWVLTQAARTRLTALWLAVRRGRAGRWSERVLRKARTLRVGGLAVVVAASGEVTTAWVEQLDGHRTVRTAYRTPGGRWSALQLVGHTTPLAYAYPSLAVASSGVVALVYNAGVRSTPGMAAAWRRAGRPFGKVAPVPGGELSQPTLVIDRAGTAFLSGIASCNNESLSRGVVLIATTSSHRFGRPRTITPHPATELRFTLTGTGNGIASWVAAGCSTTELLPGAVRVRRVDRRGAGPVSIATNAHADNLLSVPAQAGTTLTWIDAESGLASLTLVNRVGSTEPPRAPADRWMPIAADASGDEALQTAIGRNQGRPTAAAARAAGSTTVEPSPIAGPAWWTAAGSTTGRALILATSIVGTLRVATWAP